MNTRRWILIIAGSALLAMVLGSCGPAAAPATLSPAPTSQVIQETVAVATVAPAPTSAQAVEATQRPAPTATPVAALPTAIASPAVGASPIPLTESRAVELEWPPQMRLGDSDLIRLALIPMDNGYYSITTEFPDHVTVTNTVPVARPGGYDVSAVARLDAAGFEVSPTGEQPLGLPLGETVTWRWTLTPRTAGTHRLSVILLLRWTPQPGNPNPQHETLVYSKGVEVRVLSFLGLTAAQAAGAGVAGLFFGGTLSWPLAAYLLRPRRARLQIFAPNRALVIEPHPAFHLNADETTLLQVLFRRYARLVLEAEFRSGYSGARTVLALPLHADGRADAYTIAKIGDHAAIQREYENYERFVKDTLPPITARIQETPVTALTPSPAKRERGGEAGVKAALRYTFIGEPGRSPTSLREALLADSNPALLEKLFSTFGPNWWMQRHPHTFRLAQEYDRMLPAHYVLEPVGGKARAVFDGRHAPSQVRLEIGDWVTLQHWVIAERRLDGQSLSLVGETQPGQPPVRVRWQSLETPNGLTARVAATRETVLRDSVSGFDRFGLPDPLDKLSTLINENVVGTRSTIHGDLNLENVLVGPGGFVWLIDFAQTRDGHPLYDFAHLAAGVIAQLIAPQTPTPSKFLALLHADADPLLHALRGIAGRCLFNPAQPREYDLALYMACLGALKFVNLNAHQKHWLYLAAAMLAQNL